MASNQKMQEKNLIQNLISQWKIGDQFRFSKIFQISDSMGYPIGHTLTGESYRPKSKMQQTLWNGERKARRSPQHILQKRQICDL